METKMDNDNMKIEYYICPGCGEEFPKDKNFWLLEYCPEGGRAVEEIPSNNLHKN